LVVIGEDSVETHPLPANGRVTIGRGDTCDIRIEHALISREHAVITTGAAIELEDLGSRNGTKVSGEKMAPRSKRRLIAGQMIELGSTMAILQLSGGGPNKKRLATHSYFEARIEEMCTQDRAHAVPFAVLRIHVQDSVDPGDAQEVLLELLRANDVAASYAAGDYELLLAGVGAERAAQVERTIADELGEREVRIGTALFPADGTSVDALLQRAARGLRSPDVPEPNEEPIVLDPAMLDLYRIAERIALGSISVLILGETGVGKEVFAEALHRMSPRGKSRFVRLNCAAFTETLLESELFGHEKGAFTGAQRAKPGLLEIADGGTVMLDEVGEMPPATQAKLLRVLEQRQVLRVGGLEPKSVDVRFISATNRDLEGEIVRGAFRRDLYFRLNGVTLVIPPLRERPGEISPLAERFVAHASRELGRQSVPKISERALKLLLDYSWPGNVRELRNVMERAVLLSSGEEIEPGNLPLEKMSIPWRSTIPAAPDPQRTGAPLKEGEEEEQRRIMEALEKCGGNQTRAAQLLGIGRRTLTTKLTKYGMPRPKKRVE
jgi:DNA-binding NtrC family response regulator/pSer/pThr/pTyr-binding forkhead associated (FHA) protein